VGLLVRDDEIMAICVRTIRPTHKSTLKRNIDLNATDDRRTLSGSELSSRASNPSLFESYKKLIQKIEKNPFDRRLFQASLILSESYFSELGAAEEYKGFVDSLNHDPKLTQLNHKAKWSGSLSPVAITQDALTQRLLSEYLIRRRHSTTYGDTFVEDLYLQWERELYEDELDCCAVGFLEYASTEKLIDLGAGTTISFCLFQRNASGKRDAGSGCKRSSLGMWSRPNGLNERR
jgi:hypothetical protein